MFNLNPIALVRRLASAPARLAFSAELRRAELAGAYASLSPEMKALADKAARRGALLGAIAGLLILAPARAFAANKSLGDILTSANTQLGNAGPVIGTASFVGGSALGVSGVMSLKKHSENPNDPAHTLKSGSMKIAGGSALVGLSALLGSGMTTIFGDTSGNVQAGGSFKSLQ